MSEALIILFALFVWTAILTVVAVGLRLYRGRPTANEVELEELRARYARGEISHAHYDARRRQLSEEAKVGRREAGRTTS